jgi:hypothetical protein
VNKNIKLDDTKKLIQMDININNPINNNIMFNSQLNQTNPLSSIRNSTIKSNNNNIYNINLLQSPKNIYKSINFEEKSITEKIQFEDSNRKIVSKNNNLIIYIN